MLGISKIEVTVICMGLRSFLAKRLVFLVILIFVVVVFNFFIFRLPMFFGGLDPVALRGLGAQSIQQLADHIESMPSGHDLPAFRAAKAFLSESG